MTRPSSSPAEPRDPFTATADGDRLEAYAALLAGGPVHRQPLPRGGECWLVTGYEAARQALADPRLVKGGGHGPYADQLRPDVSAAIDHHLLNLDPPDHTRIRHLLTAAFTRRRSELLAPRIQQLTEALLDRLADRLSTEGTVDLMTEFAYPLPITVICELLGIPEQDRADFRAWTGPLLAGSMVSFEEYSGAAVAMVDYIHDLLEHKRAAPADDLLSALVSVHDQGDRLTEEELTSMVFLLLIAGHETTVNLITNGVRALLTNPDQLAVLRAEPERTAAAVEELLRFDGPLQSAIPALTSEPVQIGGVQMAAHEIVVISLLAANRDPARRPDADRLDVTRADTSHLAFGHGIHRCVGAPLAQVEGRIALGSLVARFPGLELAVPAADLARTPGLLMNGLVSLPVRLAGRPI